MTYVDPAAPPNVGEIPAAFRYIQWGPVIAGALLAAALASLLPSGTWAAWASAELALVLLLAPRTWWALLIAITWPGIWIDLALGKLNLDYYNKVSHLDEQYL